MEAIHLRAAEENNMASRFASVSEKEILSLNEKATKQHQMATKFGVIGKLFNLFNLNSKVKN